MSTIGTSKKIAASTAIAASLGIGGLGLASGIASAAPGEQVGSGASTNSEQQAPAPKTASGDDTEIHAHLIPGFIPKPAPKTASGDDSEIHGHLIPGFVPQPIGPGVAPSAPAATAASGNALGDAHEACMKGPGFDHGRGDSGC